MDSAGQCVVQRSMDWRMFLRDLDDAIQHSIKHSESTLIMEVWRTAVNK